MASQMRLPSLQDTPIAPRHSRIEDTPIPPLIFEDPKNARAIKNNFLPGFQNAFGDTTPFSVSQKHSHQAKGKEPEVHASDTPFKPAALHSQSLDFPSNDRTHTPEFDNDINMMEGENSAQAIGGELVHSDDDVDLIEEFESIEPFNQRAEVFMIFMFNSKVELITSDPAKQNCLVTFYTFMRRPHHPCPSWSPGPGKFTSRTCECIFFLVYSYSWSHCQYLSTRWLGILA